jgi:hypothetical protein
MYTWLFTPITIAHPLFISWWQEFHDHIFSEPVQPFCLELMPDFQTTSEVIHLSFPLSSGMPSFTDHDFWLLPAEYRACPSIKDILLQCCWPNLCLGIQIHNSAQLMARYATMDPTLISST